MTVSLDLLSTIDQLRQVDARRRYLTDRQKTMVEQVIHRAGVRWRDGQMDTDELLAFYDMVRDVGALGFVKHWKSADLPFPSIIRAHAYMARVTMPNESDGSWSGAYPIRGEHRPPDGQSVVYILYNETDSIYLGSTASLPARLRQHAQDKTFTSWRAWPCRDREHAYQREEEMLRDVLPCLNKRAGR